MDKDVNLIESDRARQELCNEYSRAISASIQPRMSPAKFGAQNRDPTGGSSLRLCDYGIVFCTARSMEDRGEPKLSY